MKNKRQNGGRRREIVQRFVTTLTDNTERLVCFLYMNNYSDGEVRKRLHLSQNQLEMIKLRLAFGLKKAGIQSSV